MVDISRTYLECARCNRRAYDFSKCAEYDCPHTQQRTIDDKISRLRARLKQTPIDANVKALLLGILDLLGDEL